MNETTRFSPHHPYNSNSTDNSLLMATARQKLEGKWLFCAKVSFVFLLINGVLSAVPGIGGLISLIFNGPLTLGITVFFLKLERNQNPELNTIFSGFDRFTKALTAYLLMVLYIVLWALLLIVPGIVAALSYAMTFYILADNEDMRASEALNRSKELMMGYKLKLFYLGLRFIGWFLLCIATLGIGFLWLIPYICTSVALFYEDIREKKLQNCTETIET